MNQYFVKLDSFLLSHPSNYGATDVNSILEFLWYCYMEYNPIHTQDIQNRFDELEPIIKALSFDDGTDLFNTVCSLCVEYEKQAFLEGLHLGAKLNKELSN